MGDNNADDNVNVHKHFVASADGAVIHVMFFASMRFMCAWLIITVVFCCKWVLYKESQHMYVTNFI